MIAPRHLAALVFSFAMALALSARAQQRLVTRAFTTADGLPSDHLFNGLRDSRGFLWFATSEGVARFDGYRFTSYGIERGLPAPHVNAVVEGPDGALWMATEDGVARLDPRAEVGPREPAVTVLPLGKDDENTAITLFNDGETLWAGAISGGLSRFVPGRGFVREPILEELKSAGLLDGTRDVRVLAIAADSFRCLWLGTTRALLRRCPGRAIERTLATGARDDRVFRLLFDHHGRMWMGHVDLGLFVFVPPPPGTPLVPSGQTLLALAEAAGSPVDGDGHVTLPSAPGAVRRFFLPEGLEDGAIRNALLEDLDGTLWAGSNTALTHIGARVQTYSPRNGLADADASPAALDSAGNLWLTTSGAGLLRLARGELSAFTARDGLAGRAAGFFRARDGELRLLTAGARAAVQRFDKAHGRFEASFPALGGKPAWGWGDVAVEEKDGALWLPSFEGLLRFPSGDLARLARDQPQRFTRKDGLSGDDIFRLFADARGDLWIGTLSLAGLTRRDHATGRLQIEGPKNGVPADDAPTAFAEDKAGDLFIGFDDGALVRRRAGEESFSAIAPPDAVNHGAVESLYASDADTLWVATERAGIIRLDGARTDAPRSRRIGPAQGLSGSLVQCLVEDRDGAAGQLYLGTQSGIDRLDPASGRVRHYSSQDGLPDGLVRSCARDRDGALWFATVSGVARLVPQAQGSAPPAPALITGLRIGDVSRPLPQLGARELAGLVLGPDESQLDVEYLSLDFVPGLPLRYQVRLAGAEQEFSAPTADRQVRYARLSPGSYRFEARAVDAQGRVSLPASVSFTVLRPLWQRPWLLALELLAIATIGWLLLRARERRLVEVERMRTRIALDLHDDLGGSLSRIAILTEVAARELEQGKPVAPRLQQIGGTARELVEAASDLVWSTDPRRDTLQSLLERLHRFAADLLEGKGIALELHVPTNADLARIQLSPGQRRQLFLILKEAVNNASRHSGATRVTLALEHAHGLLRALVRDDGRGLGDAASEKGNGLRSMEARAKQAGGALRIEHSERGTEIRFEMRV